jgi:hypothetical protein
MRRDILSIHRHAAAQTKRAISLPPAGDADPRRTREAQRANIRSARLRKQADRLSMLSEGEGN